MDNTVILVVSADDNYSMPLAVTLRSAIVNLDKQRYLLVYVLDGGIEDNNKQRVERSIESCNCRVEWVQVEKKLYEWAKPIKHLSSAAYLRLLIPTLLPSSLSKVIYLDCDIVVNSNLGFLWDIGIENSPVVAVQDSLMPYVSSSGALARYSELGLPPNAKYFNSGVLLINLERWRADSILERAVHYVEEFGNTLNYADQDVLNALFSLSWKELDPRWNQQISSVAQRQQIFDAFIIHFSTPFKPWSYSGMKEADRLFFQYLDQTEFSNLKFKLYLNRWHNSIRRSFRIGTRLKQIGSLSRKLTRRVSYE
jgi:lipopolysaccharide biosynthesis glycosyltransferase